MGDPYRFGVRDCVVGVTASSALSAARHAAESRMVDSCVVSRNSATAGLDADGMPIAGSPTPVYSGRCFLLEARVQNPNPSDVAGDFPVTEALTLKVPALAAQLLVGDVVVMTACPDHPRDVGARLRVSSINPGTQRKSQNCQVEVIAG